MGTVLFFPQKERLHYRIKNMELIIIVISVGHRKEIYKKLKDLLE